MKELVKLEDGQPITTTLAIADGTENQHEAVIKLVRKYRDDLEEFGPLGFEIHVVSRQQGGGTKGEYATLNEQQSTLLLTYMRNSEVVRQFKKALVKAFWELKNGEASGPKIPKTLGQALYLAAKLEGEREALAKKVAEDKPKVDFYPAAQIRH